MNLDCLKSKTECGKRLEELEQFYLSLDKDLNDFDSKMGIACKCDSGSCCEHYVPELTAAEAEYLAYVIIKDGKVEEVLKKLSGYERPSGVCPLYKREGDYHCSLYSGRGLLCRLFGAACFSYKDEKPHFKACRWNRDKKDIDSISTDVKIPVMSVYGRALANIDGVEDTESIEIAIVKAINKLNFILGIDEADV